MTDKTKPRYWAGTIEKCQVCNLSIGNKMIDGAMHTGHWANMCKACHKQYGRGLGLGRGQEYTRITRGCDTPMQCEKIAHIPFATMQTLRTQACADGCELVGRWLKTGG